LNRFSGNALAERRKELGLRHEDVAVGVDRTASAIRMYEAGAIDPPASIVCKLADVLRIDPGRLFVSENER